MMRVLRITIRVRNQEQALEFYTEKLSFEKRADLPMGADRRWLTVAPKDDAILELVHQPSDWFEGEERQHHDDPVGSDPAILFQVDDCRAAHRKMAALGVEFSTPPADRPHGIEAEGRDLYGNALVFLQLSG